MTIHQNLGQDLDVSPTTIEDTLDMVRAGWPYPNLSYPEAMAMIQNINSPKILGKELNDCVLAWQYSRIYDSMFSLASNKGELTLKFADEATFFKQNHNVKQVKENSPKLDTTIKRDKPGILRKVSFRLYQIWE